MEGDLFMLMDFQDTENLSYFSELSKDFSTTINTQSWQRAAYYIDEQVAKSMAEKLNEKYNTYYVVDKSFTRYVR